MVCEKNETDLDINIPAVLLPRDAGFALHTVLTSGNSGNSLTHCGHLYFHFHARECFFFNSLWHGIWLFVQSKIS